MNRDDILNVLQTRKWTYFFLGRNYYDLPNWRKLSSDNNLKILESIKMNSDNEEITYISNILINLDEEKIKLLNNEYTRLFVGPEKIIVPPWSSVYLNPEGIIFDENTLEVRKFYRNWNIKIMKLKKEPDDHIGIELEFMYLLIDKAIANIDNVVEYKDLLKGQKEFLNRHILNWIDEFTDNLIKNTELNYYKHLGQLTKEYLHMDNELIEDLILN